MGKLSRKHYKDEDRRSKNRVKKATKFAKFIAWSKAKFLPPYNHIPRGTKRRLRKNKQGE